MLNRTKIYTGTANPGLAQQISNILNLPLGEISVDRFSDGEIQVEIHDHVRGDTVFIVQPTCAPANDNLMELLIMGDAFRRSSVKRMIAVIPYYGYARQDRRPDYVRAPITSRMVADMIESVGFESVVTVDIHSLQQQGFFRIPSINVSAQPEIIADIYRTYKGQDLVVVSPDVGGTSRARAVAKQLDVDLAIVDKRRPAPNVSEVMNIIGDVNGRVAILVDDMADTCSTLCKAANALCDMGASKVVSYVTHGVLSGNAVQTIEESCLSEMVITDTIPFHTGVSNKIRVMSMAPLLAETIRRIREKESVSEIYA